MSTKVKTGKVRLSYANIHEPKAAPGQTEEKYSVCLLIEKEDTETVKAIQDAIAFAKEEGKNKLQKSGKWLPNLKLPLRDGDAERDDDPNYVGKWFMNCSSKTKPGMVKKVDGALMHITNKEDLYSGCFAKVTVNMFAFNTNGNAGIGVGLNNILFVADGEPLAGRASAESDFADDTDEENLLD